MIFRNKTDISVRLTFEERLFLFITNLTLKMALLVYPICGIYEANLRKHDWHVFEES